MTAASVRRYFLERMDGHSTRNKRENVFEKTQSLNGKYGGNTDHFSNPKNDARFYFEIRNISVVGLFVSKEKVTMESCDDDWIDPWA